MAFKKQDHSSSRSDKPRKSRFTAFTNRNSKRMGFGRLLRIEPLEERRMLAVFLVNTDFDSVDPNDGLTSLREAIVSANAAAGPDTINFDGSLSNKTILLTHGELLIADSVTINGLGADLLTVDASGNDPTPTQKNQDGSRVLNIDSPNPDYISVAIQGLTITGGDSPGEHDAAHFRQGGGAIRNEEDLTLMDCTITNNSGYKGGAIATEGPLQIVSCVISGNASFFKGGGAIYADNEEPVSVTNSTITGNTSHSGGGAIYQNVGHNWGWITVTNSSITHNTANGSGGGILADLVTISSSDISNNTSTRYGGGVYSTEITMTSSVVSDNTAVWGGGVHCDSNPSSIVDSVISGNSAEKYGGGVYSSNELTISNTTIEGNISHWAGGGIYGHYYSVVTLDHSVIRGNSVVGGSDSSGGGVFSRNTLDLFDSNISGNTASGSGGGISNFGYFTRITRCTITGNSSGWNGGGIHIRFYYLELNDSDVSNNTAGNLGGGIEWDDGISKPLVISRSTITGNSAQRGGGLHGGGGSCNITQSDISNNTATYEGGGIFNVWGGSILTMTGSTISGNTARSGGGIYTYGLTLVNCLVTNNTATQNGGGIFSLRSTPILRNSTVTANSASDGGGVFISNGVMTISDTIIARNLAEPGTGEDIVGQLAAKFSLIGDNSGSIITDSGGNLIGSSLAPIDPLLGPLVYNGGPSFLDGSRMLTRSLLPGSPAINAGDPSAMAGMSGVPLNDQRGVHFTRVDGGRIDIGAIESQANPLPGDYNFDGHVDAADYSMWRMTLGSKSDLRADGDGNGMVDNADYDFWRAHFGNSLALSGVGIGAETAVAKGVESGVARPNRGEDTLSLYAASSVSAAGVRLDVSKGNASPAHRSLLARTVIQDSSHPDLLLESRFVNHEKDHHTIPEQAHERRRDQRVAESPRKIKHAVDQAFAILGAFGQR